MRYTAYLEEEAILPCSTNCLTDKYDYQDNAFNIGIYISNQLAASIRIHFVNLEHKISPVTEAFPEFIKPVLDATFSLIDPNRFVVNKDISKDFPELHFAVLRAPFMAGNCFRRSQSEESIKAFTGKSYNFTNI